MRSLWESILDNDEDVVKDVKKTAERYKFENDLDYQRKVLLDVLLTVFDDCEPYDDSRSIAIFTTAMMSTRELNKKIKELHSRLEEFNYFEKFEEQRERFKGPQVFRLKCFPPITPQCLFPEVIFTFVTNVKGTHAFPEIHIAITDKRDYNYDWKKLRDKR